MYHNLILEKGINLPNLQIKRLLQSDIKIVQKLCEQWFPIYYPKKWYLDITSNPKFHALAAYTNNELIGLIVGEIKPLNECNREDNGLLSKKFPDSTKVAYILILGVVFEYRRKGIATFLLENFIDLLTTKNINKDCKAIYLHVLSTNDIAINFYEKKKFLRHLYLPLYYYIDGSYNDGYSYVHYVNGGYGPFFLIDNFLILINFFNNDFNIKKFFFNLLRLLQKIINLVLRKILNTRFNETPEKGQILFC